MHLSETDASLLSWLHALPIDTFSCPFEEKPLKLNMERFVKPNLEATWADAILATPIKPQQLFPYNAVPSGRSRNTELMSRSLAPQYEGLSFGLSKSQIFTSGVEMKLNPSASSPKPKTNGNLNDLTRSIALFNLDTKSSSSGPNTPANFQLQPNTNNLLTSSFMNRHNVHMLNGIKEEEAPITNSPPPSSSSSSSSTSSSTTSNHNVINGNVSQKSPPNPPPTSITQLVNSESAKSPKVKAVSPDASASLRNSSNPMHDSTLFKEYQKNKAQIIQQLEEQEKRRDEFVKQLKCKCYRN